MFLKSKKGLVGWIMVFASVFVWLLVVALWYKPSPVLDPSDKTNMMVAFWWTLVCAACAFIGLRIEKKRLNEEA